MGPTAYGAGSPTYQSVEQQRSALEGRLQVARGIRDRAAPGSRTRQRWSRVVDELLDRLLEVRGL
jgi:hypothetical protein